MKKVLFSCLLATSFLATAQVGPPQSNSPNTNNGYGFTQSTGSYTPLSASRTVWQSGATLGTDAASPAISLPFTFKYNNKNYTSIFISNNGFITFGNAPLPSNTSGLSENHSTSSVSNVVDGSIAGFSTNLRNANTTTSEIAYESVGSKFIVQFTDLQGNAASAAQLLNFQLQLDSTDNSISIVYGTCASGSATLTGQVGIRGAENSDTNNRSGSNWTTTAVGTSNSSTVTLGLGGGTAVPASGLTFTYNPGTWLTAPTSFATLPYTENFSSWANGNSTADLPNATYWRTWPSRGDNSWRQSDISSGFTSASGWEGTSGSATISSPAVAPAARFHTYNSGYFYQGYMDLYVNLSTGGVGERVISFDYINTSGSDKLEVLLSTDGGSTFSSLGTALGIEGSWVNKSFFTTSTSQNAIVRFLATSDFGTTDIYVDNLSINTNSTVPSCSVINSPADNATNVSRTPTFTWTGSQTATSYIINLGTTPGGTDIMNNVDVGNTTSYTVPAASTLLYGTQYYLTVLPKNSYGNATGCTQTAFKTVNISCPTVSLPANNAINQPTNPTITWAASADASSYRISVGTTPGGTDVLNNFDVGNVLMYQLSGLINATKYYYTINAYTSYNTSSISCSERNFTTICQATTAPYSENFDTTAVGSTSNTNAPSCWAYVETSGHSGYGYVVSSSGNFTSSPNSYYMYNSGQTSGNMLLVSPTTTNLMDGTFRVRFMAKGDKLVVGTMSDPTNPSTFTAIGSTITLTSAWKQYFVNIPAGTNQNLAIKQGSTSLYYSVYIDDISIEAIPACAEPTNLSAGTITYKSGIVSWNASASAPTNNYDIYLSTSSSTPASTAIPTYTNVTSPYTLSTLNPSTIYYVWVRSNCGNSTSPWAPLPSFTTSSFCPTVTAPAANATGVSLTPTFTWSALTAATGYKISIGTTSGGTDILNNYDVGNVLTYTHPTALNESTRYYYTINAYDADVTSQSCTVRSFTTVCGILSAPLTENFNSGSLPTCWSTSSTNNTSYALWLFGNSPQDYGTTYSASGQNNTAGQFAYVDASDPYSGVHDVTLLSPQINLTGLSSPTVGFRWFKNHGSVVNPTSQPNYDNNKLTVQVKDITTSTWETIFTSSTNAATWRTESILLPANYLGKTVQVRFVVDKDVAGNGYFYDNLLLDDFSVTNFTNLATTEIKPVKSEIKIYPNPFSDVLNISDIEKVKSISIMDASGKMVRSFDKPDAQLRLSDLNSGMYMVILNMKDGSRQTIKAIKK